MHELSIAQEIIDIAKVEMFARKLNRISKIGLRVGALCEVDTEALNSGFESSTAGSKLDGAKLEIEFLPITGTCNSCQREFKVKNYLFTCPHCGSDEVSVTEGGELDIAYFIGE